MSESSTKLMAKHLHLDCFSGVSGDMFLGAMLDLGVPESVIRDGLQQLPLDGYEFWVGRKTHHSVSGCDVQVRVHDHAVPHHDHEADHDHHDHSAHAHRHYRDIRALIERSTLSTEVKARAFDIFDRVARAEAKIHRMPVEDVAFHEVGAIDSIVDIVGAAIAVAYLKPAKVTSRRVPLGSGGYTKCAHGLMPIPAPATLEILAEVRAETEGGGIPFELCTPTGAAIVASLVQSFSDDVSGVPLVTGYGAGDRELKERPNLLRAVLFELVDTTNATLIPETLCVLEANLDDLNPEIGGYLFETMFSLGALDVWSTPIVMKKQRAAFQLSVLCRIAERERVLNALFAESTTIGIRSYVVDRYALSRRTVTIETPHGPVDIKEALSPSGAVLNAMPEYEHCAALARSHHVPLKQIYAEALAAYRSSLKPLDR